MRGAVSVRATADLADRRIAVVTDEEAVPKLEDLDPPRWARFDRERERVQR
ncbi:MAG: hypothetical protein ACKV2T_44020 [Kofleriaceae bacterium]